MGSVMLEVRGVTTMLFHLLTILSFLGPGLCQNSDIYWGSYELTIPGGSGSGNAVQHLNLPENAPEFFQFSALKTGPAAAPTFPPPAAQPAPLEVTPQLQPTSQPQHLQVFTQRNPSPQQRLTVVGSEPETNSDGSGSATLSRFQLFQRRRKQQTEESEDAAEVKNDQKNLDVQKPVKSQRRLRKVAIRRRKPQNKE